MSMKLVNWNVNWATPRSNRFPKILDRVYQHSPEIICLTETHAGLLQGGHAICAGPNYGYGIQKPHRKVVLWSRQPWEHEDYIGDDRLPPGRFISGVTRTSLGELTVVGVCIPWSGSRAGARYSGERQRTWEDHEGSLEHLAGVLSRAPSKRLVVLGDFNQRIARSPWAAIQRECSHCRPAPTGYYAARDARHFRARVPWLQNYRPCRAERRYRDRVLGRDQPHLRGAEAFRSLQSRRGCVVSRLLTTAHTFDEILYCIEI